MNINLDNINVVKIRVYTFQLNLYENNRDYNIYSKSININVVKIRVYTFQLNLYENNRDYNIYSKIGIVKCLK